VIHLQTAAVDFCAGSMHFMTGNNVNYNNNNNDNNNNNNSATPANLVFNS